MAGSINQVSNNIREIQVNGTAYLGIRIAATSGKRSVKRFVEDGLDPGYIVHGQTLEVWKPLGLTEVDGQVYLYGPFFEGRTVESVLAYEPRVAVSYLERLARAYALFIEQGKALPRLQTNGIFFLDDGGTLILPPIVLERLRNVQVEADRIRTFDVYNHPDLSGERAIVFSLSVLCYRVAVGAMPFVGDDEIELHHEMRDLKPTQAHYRNPDVRPDVSELLQRGMDAKALDAPTLVELVERFDDWSKSGLFASVSEERRQLLLQQGERIEKRARTAYARRRYLSRNGRTLAAALVGAIIVGSVAFSIIRNVTAPRVTLGMSPLEVVSLFYSSINTLDHAAIEDAVAKGVARGEINEATNLYVISRVRLGNEGTLGFVTPDEWIEAGRPALDETMHVYGIDQLEIRALSETRYVVEYRKWEQALTETLAFRIAEANSTVRRRQDVLSLEFDGTYWLIVDIERVIDDLIDPDELTPE